MNPRPPVIVVMGPTAAGKTDLAISASRRWPIDLISVDSALVYRGLDIGSAKPDRETLRQSPHRLVDIREPWQTYSAADFAVDAQREIDAIHGNGRIPLLVGGTGLYFRALLDGLSDMPAADPQVRCDIEREADLRGWPALHAELAAFDAYAAQRIKPGDTQRISRAIEVFRISGVPISEWQTGGNRLRPPWRVVKIVVSLPRSELHRRIAQRFEQMLAHGFLDEVQKLRSLPQLNPELPSMRAVGYRQAWRHLDGATDRATFIEEGVAATRQLCKRQFTWLRRELDAIWLSPTRPEADLQRILCGFLGRSPD